MRLKLAASGSKFSVGPHGLNGVEPALDIHQVVPAGGQHGVHFVVPEAANVAEVVANAIQEKLRQRLRLRRVSLRSGSAQLPFDQDLDHALRRAAQRERVARAARNQPDARSSPQGVQLVGQRHDAPGRACAGIESSMLTGL